MDDIFFGDDVIETPSALTPMDTEAQKRVMNVFVIVDTSGSMKGERIGSVNQAIRETLPALEEVQNMNPGVEIRLSLMSFASEARWLTPLPEPVDRFVFANFTTGGGTNAGHAFELLDYRLTRKGFMRALGGHFAPLILFLSDGESISGWMEALEALRKNIWYKCATRVAIAAGKDATTSEALRLFSEFTENMDMVVYADEPDRIRDFIVLVSVQASKWNASHTAQKASSEIAFPAAAKTPAKTSAAVQNPLLQDARNTTPSWWNDIKKKVDFPPIPTLD